MNEKYIDILKNLKNKIESDDRISDDDKKCAIGHLNEVFAILPYDEISQ